MTGLPRRLGRIPAKLRRNGWRWAWTRLTEEIFIPTTGPGRCLRDGWVKAERALSRLRRSDSGADCLTLFYDLQVMPITYDMVTVLAYAEIERRRLGLAAIDVVIVPGWRDGLREETADYEAIIDTASRRWRIDHLLVPLAERLSTPHGVSICRDREAAAALHRRTRHVFPVGYSVAFPLAVPLIEPCRRADETRAALPILRASAKAHAYVRAFLAAHVGDRPVTILTLRSYGYSPRRNSDPEIWADIARRLVAMGEAVVVVPDTDDAFRPATGPLAAYLHADIAAIDIDIRLALFEQAHAVLGVAQGPLELCWLSDRCRYVLSMDTDAAEQTSARHAESQGFTIGQPPPYALPVHIWLWERQNADLILDAFKRILVQIEALPPQERTWYPWGGRHDKASKTQSP